MTDHKPFGELSDAEKGALLLDELNGQIIERVSRQLDGSTVWIKKGSEPWLQRFIYRVRPS